MVELRIELKNFEMIHIVEKCLSWVKLSLKCILKLKNKMRRFWSVLGFEKIMGNDFKKVSNDYKKLLINWKMI